MWSPWRSSARCGNCVILLAPELSLHVWQSSTAVLFTRSFACVSSVFFALHVPHFCYKPFATCRCCRTAVPLVLECSLSYTGPLVDLPTTLLCHTNSLGQTRAPSKTEKELFITSSTQGVRESLQDLASTGGNLQISEYRATLHWLTDSNLNTFSNSMRRSSWRRCRGQ